MENQIVIDVFSKIFAVYNLFLIISSVILNTFLIFICVKRKNLREISTFKLFAFSAFNDILTCLVWNEESFTNTFFDFRPYSRSLLYCRLMSMFLQYTTMELESWLLVSISLDRALSLSISKWSRTYFKGLRPIAYCIVLTIFVIGVNINQLFTLGYTKVINGTEAISCFISFSGDLEWYQLNNQVTTNCIDLIFSISYIINIHFLKRFLYISVISHLTSV